MEMEQNNMQILGICQIEKAKDRATRKAPSNFE